MNKRKTKALTQRLQLRHIQGITLVVIPKPKLRFPGYQINWMSDWLIGWVRNFSPWASISVEAETEKHWHRGSLWGWGWCQNFEYTRSA